MRILKLTALIFISILISVPLVSAEPHLQLAYQIDPDRQFQFAEKYFLEQDYFNAISEYKRFIYFFPQDGRVGQATFKIGQSYFRNNEYNKALNFLKKVSAGYGGTPLAVKAVLMQSECYLSLQALGPAVSVLEQLAAHTRDSDIRDEAFYRIGWIYFDTESWNKARTFFEKIAPQNRRKYRLSELLREFDAVGAIPQKNPALAGLLGLIPGAGYLYTARYHDALIASLLNGALILSAYTSFENENYALGAILTFVEIGFYSGSIYGSVSAVHKYNRRQTRDFIQNIKQNKKVHLSGGYMDGGGFIALRIRF